MAHLGKYVYSSIEFVKGFCLIFEIEVNSCCWIADRTYLLNCFIQLEWIGIGINLVLVGILVFYETLY